MAKRFKGRQILMDTLAAEGVTKLFGNPGTTELPLVDSLNDYPQFDYVLCLHEGVAVGAADAYARASGTVGFANVHVAPGLGNAIGHIYNARIGKTPMVITAGQQDTRLRLREPMLSHDLVEMAAPVTKWSVEATTTDELPHVLNRAFKVARDAPTGPVFVSLPLNVLEGETDSPPMAPSPIFRRSLPDPEGIREAAALLAAAKNPVIVCGNGITMAGANAELVALAELLGAQVYHSVLMAAANFPTGHPAFREQLPGDYGAMRRMLGQADAVLLVAGEFFEEVWYEEGLPFHEDAALIQLDPAPHQLARNFTLRVGLTGDPKLGLAALCESVQAAGGAELATAAQTRRTANEAAQERAIAKQQARAEGVHGNQPMHPARLMAELRAVLPADAIIATEAITSGSDLRRTIPRDDPSSYMGTWSGGIGQGLPMALGVQLAHPQRPVVCVSGDGSAMYTIQSLWTAAYHKLPVIFVILSNRTYRILKLNMNIYRSRFGIGGERGYPHLDLADPALQFVELAKGMGVAGRLIEKPEDFGPAFTEALQARQPFVLDCVVDGAL